LPNFLFLIGTGYGRAKKIDCDFTVWFYACYPNKHWLQSWQEKHPKCNCM